MPTTLPTAAQVAAEYCCNPRTAAHWKQQGAPVSDPPRMRLWLASRTHIPPETRRMLAAERRQRRATIANREIEDPAPDPKIGAAPALSRLEHAEIEAFRRFEEAKASGDLAELKVAQALWLNISESLRKFDLLVEQSRRASGELVQKGQVEKAISDLVQTWKICCIQSCNSLAPDIIGVPSIQAAAEILSRTLLESIFNSLAVNAAKPCKARVPDWIIRAAVEPLSDSFPAAGEALDARTEALKQAAAAMVQESSS